MRSAPAPSRTRSSTPTRSLRTSSRSSPAISRTSRWSEPIPPGTGSSGPSEAGPERGSPALGGAIPFLVREVLDRLTPQKLHADHAEDDQQQRRRQSVEARRRRPPEEQDQQDGEGAVGHDAGLEDRGDGAAR